MTPGTVGTGEVVFLADHLSGRVFCLECLDLDSDPAEVEQAINLGAIPIRVDEPDVDTVECAVCRRSVVDIQFAAGILPGEAS